MYERLYYSYLLSVVAVISLCVSCSDYEDYFSIKPGSEKAAYNTFLEDARKVFEGVIAVMPDTRNNCSTDSPSVGNLTPGIFTPEWESATVNKNSSRISANVPIITEFKYLAKVEETKNGGKRWHIVPMPQKLIAVKDPSTGLMNCYIMTLIPTRDCTNKFKRNLDGMFFNSKVNEKFSGIVIYSSIASNYEVVRIDKYIAGRKVKAASTFGDAPYMDVIAQMQQIIGTVKIGRRVAALNTSRVVQEGWEVVGENWIWGKGEGAINCRVCQPCKTHAFVLMKCTEHGGTGKCSECLGSGCHCNNCSCEDGVECSMTTCSHDVGEVVVTPCTNCDYCEIHQFDIYCKPCAEEKEVFFYGYCPGCKTAPDPNPEPGETDNPGGGYDDESQKCSCVRTRGTKCKCNQETNCECSSGGIYLVVPDKVPVGGFVNFEVYPSTITSIKIFVNNLFTNEKELVTNGHGVQAMSPGHWTFHAKGNGGRYGQVQSSPVTVEVLLPSGQEIKRHPDFMDILAEVWSKTWDALKGGERGGVLQEFGCWLYYTPNGDRITKGGIDHGNQVSFAYEGNVGISPGPRNPNSYTNDFTDGSGSYAVGYLHTHVPMTYVTGPYMRYSGPSPSDIANRNTETYPGFVYDYITNELKPGHDITWAMTVTAFGVERAISDY